MAIKTRPKGLAGKSGILGNVGAGIESLTIFAKCENAFRPVVSIALVSVFVLALAPPKASAESNYYRYYFKKNQPLELDGLQSAARLFQPPPSATIVGSFICTFLALMGLQL